VSLAPNATIDIPGDLLTALSSNTRRFAALQAALLNNSLEIISTPRSVYIDAGSGAVRQLQLANGAISAVNPSWGGYVGLLTGLLTITPSTTPTSSPVTSATLVFNNAVTGFGLAGLSLTRAGGANLLAGGNAPTTADNITWTIPGLTGLTGTSGIYVLSVPVNTAVLDAFGNSVTVPISVTWTHT
jgi:hypothetical protein